MNCSHPIDATVLADYWLAALPGPEEDAVEEHLFGCDECGTRLREVIALAEGVRNLARGGSLRMIVSEEFLQRVPDNGLSVPEHLPPAGGRVHVAGNQDAARRQRIPMPEGAAQSGYGWPRAGVVVTISILAMLGSCTGLDVWADRQVEAEIAKIEAHYGSLDERTSRVPPVPAADDRASIVRAAAALAVGLPGQRFHSISTPVPSPVPADLRAFADANRAAIRLAGDIRTRRQSSWGLDTRSGDSPPLQEIRILADAIYVATLLNLEAGRADVASQLIVSGLGISASLRQEPEIVVQMTRTNVVMQRQFSAIRQLLTTSAPSKTALKELASWLDENRMPDGMLVPLLGEVKAANAIFARMENGHIDPDTAAWIYPMTWPEWPSVFLELAARIGRPLVRTARLRYLHRMTQLLDAESGPRPRRLVPDPPAPQRWALIDRLADKFAAGAWLYSEVGDAFMSDLSTTEVAVALRRFKLDHNTYPDDLSALVPAYLARLPIDPYTGRPPVYARQGAGFTLRAKDSRPGVDKSRVLAWNVPK